MPLESHLKISRIPKKHKGFRGLNLMMMMSMENRRWKNDDVQHDETLKEKQYIFNICIVWEVSQAYR
jgi:hypothetical protein